MKSITIAATVLSPLLALAGCASENTTGLGGGVMDDGSENGSMSPGAGPGEMMPGGENPGMPGDGTPSTGNPGMEDPAIPSGGAGNPGGGTGSTNGGAGTDVPNPGPGPGNDGGSTAMGGTANGGAPSGGAPPAGACGDGFTELAGKCVKTAALCGTGVCGLGQTCQADACVGSEGDLIVVEAENFTDRMNPGNIRDWYIADADTLGADNKLTGFPCLDTYHCDDSSGTAPNTRSGNSYIEILPDTRRGPKDRMLTYCSGLPGACAHPSITEDDDLEVITKKPFPGYQGTDDHTNAEFYPIPGEGPMIGYTVNFTKPGIYFIWGMGGRTTAEGNSIHVGIDGTWPKTGRGLIWCAGDGWYWSSARRGDVTIPNFCNTNNTLTITVPTAGVHTIWFSVREDGFQFDKWIATTNRQYEPRGIGQAEIGRVEVSNPQPPPAPKMP